MPTWESNPVPFDKGDALVRFWLHAEPADDFETWGVQLAQAGFIEERTLRALAQIIHGKKAVK